MRPLKIVKNASNKIFNGFLLVDKPKNMTSNDLCQILKKRYGIKSCGHVGTLDPDATGLMVLAFGRATKLLPLLDTNNKTYVTTILFGKLTDTLDISGNLIKEEIKKIDKNLLTKAFITLQTQKAQIPPLTSAIKVNGKKLLDYQRQGKEVEIKERPCEILSLDILKDLYKEGNYFLIDLRLKVSKGYYIRSFARDLGELVNNMAIVKDLRRIRVGEYDIKDAYTLDTLLNEEISLIEITNFLKYVKIEIKERILRFAQNGVTLYEHNLLNDSDAKDIKKLKRFIVSYLNEPVAIYENKGKEFRPIFKF